MYNQSLIPYTSFILEPWFSHCGCQTSGLSITWKLTRDASVQSWPRTHCRTILHLKLYRQFWPGKLVPPQSTLLRPLPPLQSCGAFRVRDGWGPCLCFFSGIVPLDTGGQKDLSRLSYSTVSSLLSSSADRLFSFKVLVMLAVVESLQGPLLPPLMAFCFHSSFCPPILHFSLSGFFLHTLCPASHAVLTSCPLQSIWEWGGLFITAQENIVLEKKGFFTNGRCFH